jgi:ABC-type polysaccharide/polyol phosphate transport system ATPase subunit
MAGPDSGVAVEVTDARKAYRIYHGQGRGYLRSRFAPPSRRRNHYTENVALDGVSLTIASGEIVGVIGRNGSGKSTLLKLIAGITRPTSGHVEVRGEVRCLLGTGVGFNPRFTGRENILFGSMAMGIPREIAEERMDEIIEFAELDDQIDQPTLVYSAGMKTRLAAAVAFQEVPEIFMLDEALSAGDAYFSKKCDARIEEICATGKTVIMVTHSTSAIERLCGRAILIDRGKIVGDGSPASVVAQYRRSVAATRDPEEAVETVDGHIELQNAYMSGADGRPVEELHHGEAAELHVKILTNAPIPLARISLELFTGDPAVRVTSLGARYVNAETGALASFDLPNLDGRYEMVLRWPYNPLGTGEYYWNVTMWPPPTPDAAQWLVYLRAFRVAPFRCVSFPEDSWMQRPAILEIPSLIDVHPIDGSLSVSATRSVDSAA